ncbi:universal stress protein [Haladaptatus pallidirubidus]|uniref:Universal stress protein n=1 Tax=Haladaptatus pallidirubidus TaxID=1008152 RepID=A0AAV3URP4_9EURY|nr:universal stress protein [Haladaptatus pallidirubidus]
MSEHVLVPLDGSPQADQALEYALTVPDVEINVITIINPFDVDPLTPGYQSPVGKSGMPAYSQEWYEKYWNDAEELHEQARERVEEHELPFESVIKMGDPAHQIVEYTADHDIDHIIMGTHGRTGLSHVVLGSVAEKVVHRSPVMVTVVR